MTGQNATVLFDHKIENDSLSKGIAQVEELLSETVNSEVEILRDASRHILQAGGKRIRPQVALASYAAAGGTDLSQIIPIAAAIELVHTASVVHDDINDHGVIRRGRPSINAIWGRTFALLTGDFLFTKVYELMAPYKDLNMILAEATVALVEGETLQANAVKENDFSREIYLRIISLKTAALFKASAHLGAAMAGASKQKIRALEQYGYNIGLAFQIVDDILDLTTDTEKLGKTAGIDVEQGRGIAIAYTEKSDNGKASSNHSHDVMAVLQNKFTNDDTIAEGRAQANQLVQVAIHSLEIFSASQGKDALIELANLVIARDH